MSKYNKNNFKVETEEPNEIEEGEELDEEIDEDENEDEDDDFYDVDENTENEQNECLIDKLILEDDDFFENDNDSDINVNEENILRGKDRISFPRLTNYELVRILGERTVHLTKGAKPLIKNHENLSYEQIAEEELKLNMIPFKIKRPLPNGKYELWDLNELYKDHLAL